MHNVVEQRVPVYTIDDGPNPVLLSVLLLLTAELTRSATLGMLDKFIVAKCSEHRCVVGEHRGVLWLPRCWLVSAAVFISGAVVVCD